MKPFSRVIFSLILSVCICSSFSHAKDSKKDLKALRTQAEAGDVSAMNSLASLLLTAEKSSLRDYKEALVWAQRAVRADEGRRAEYLDTLAAAEFENGNYDEALAAEREALALKPDEANYSDAVQDYGRIAQVDADMSSKSTEQTGQAGVTAPRAVSAPSPDSPIGKFRGMVAVYAVVAEDGRVRTVLVRRSLNPYLDRKALAAVKRWVFEPAKKGGRPVAVPVIVEVNFRID